MEVQSPLARENRGVTSPTRSIELWRRWLSLRSATTAWPTMACASTGSRFVAAGWIHDPSLETHVSIAQVLRKETRGNSVSYFVHWQGWNKKHDGWIGPDRIMPENSVTRELMERVNAEVKAREAGASAAALPVAAASPAAVAAAAADPKARKRALDAINDSEDLARPAVSLKLPFALKKLLIDDWEVRCSLVAVLCSHQCSWRGGLAPRSWSRSGRASFACPSEGIWRAVTRSSRW